MIDILQTAKASPKPLGGRPLSIETPQEAWRLGMEYINMRKAQSKPLLMTGLANYMGIDYTKLSEYKKRQGFSDIITRLIGFVKEQYEENIYNKEVAPACAIFGAKNVLGWTDRQEISTTSQGVDINRLIDQLQGGGVKGADSFIDIEQLQQ